MIEFTTDTANLSAFWDKVEKFNNKAIALGLNEVVVDPKISEPRVHEIKDDITGMVVGSYSEVDVTLPEVEIRIPGDFTFVAVVEHLGDANMINRSPLVDDEVVIPAEYRTAEPTCDHCGHVRMRNTTIVVQNAEGEFKRVGSTCAQSYLGISAAKLVTLFAMLENVCRDDYGSSHGEEGTTALTYLTVVASVIRQYGWVSRGVAREYDKVATADIAWRLLFGKRDGRFGTLVEFPEMFEGRVAKFLNDAEAEAEAEAALEWLTAEIDPESSDYFWNLSVAVRQGIVNRKRAGIVGSLVAVWQREMGRRAEREAAETFPESTHYGDVKGRYDFEAMVLYTRYSEGYAYGTTDVFAILRTDAGHILYTSTGTHTGFGEILDNASQGDRLIFKATVKAHTTNKNNEKVTRVNRCKEI